MLTLFRKIRRTVIGSGALHKYATYALGEILLVVIGILIALQINNWNEDRKSHNIEQQYLLALQDEFQININKLKELATLLERQLDATDILIKHTHPYHTLLDKSNFAQLMAEGFRDTYNYVPSSGVMKDLINSGRLSLITNNELRRILADWDADVSTLKELEDEAKKASYDVVEILRTQGNFRNQMNIEFKDLGTGPSPFNTANNELLNDEIMESSVVYFTGVTWRLKNVLYPKFIRKMEVVLNLIKEDLD